MKEFQLSTNNTICLHGRKIPQGAIYGTFNGIIYICDNFKTRLDSRNNTYFNAYKLKYTESAEKSIKSGGTRSKCTYESTRWTRYRIYIDSPIGKRILHYVTFHYKKYGKEPVCKESNHKSNRRLNVAELQKRPVHHQTVERVPDGSNAHAIQVHAGLYTRDGYFKSHLISPNIHD